MKAASRSNTASVAPKIPDTPVPIPAHTPACATDIP